jgi:hypothetical protein
MPNKTGRKELSSDKIAVILTLHKLGYTASQIGREEGLTKTDNYLPDPTRSKHQNDPFIKAIQTGKRRATTLTSTWCLLGTFRALRDSGEPRRVTTGSIFGKEEGTTVGCNKFWRKFSCEAIRALPTSRPGSNRIANLLSNRIGAHRYLPRRHYGKLNILGQYIRRAS